MSTTKSKLKKNWAANKAPSKKSGTAKASAPVKTAAPKRASAATRKAAPARKAAPKAAAAKKNTSRKAVSARAAPAQAPKRKAPASSKAASRKTSTAGVAPRKAAAKTAPTGMAKPPAAPAKTAQRQPQTSAGRAAPSKPAVAKAPADKAVPGPQPAAPAEIAKPVDGKARLPAQNGVETGMPAKKPTARSEFKPGEHIVYPAHGVGRIVGIDMQEVAGIKLELFVISFIKDKMTLRVPVPKATSVGMRKLADPATVKRALETVRGRARIKRTMWSRRAQEYEAKINSGDLIAIAEVVRDLYRSENQPEQSYSERQLYEAALDRMAREISSVSRISETEAIRQIEQNLAKSPRRGAKPEGVETTQDKAA